MNLRKVLESGSVVRYHSTLIDKKQNNAEHSWETAIILAHIYPLISADLLMYALTHDAAEIYTSDVAAPVKRANPELKEAFDEMEKKYREEELELPNPNFTKEAMLALKYADIISGLYFTTRRANAGDREAAKIRDVWLEYAGSLPYLNKRAEQAIKELKQ